MSEQVGSAYFDLSLQKQGFDKGLNEASKSITEFGGKVSDIGKNLSTSLTLPIAGIGIASFKMAADFQDAMGATDQIFKGQSENMKKWADELPTYYGIAKGEALQYSNTMGAMLQNIGGLTEEQASKQAQTLMQLAGDLTAMYGGTVQDAVRALTGSLKGNNTMLDNYGMAVNDVMIKTRALEMGLIKEGEELSLTAKQTATLNLIQEQSSFVTGQASREADGASGTMRALWTEIKNLGIEIGNILIPILLPLIARLKEWAEEFKKLDPNTKKMIVVVGLIVAALGPLLVIVGQLITAFGIVAGAISAPVVIIGLLIAGLVLLQTQFGIFDPIINGIRVLFESLKMTWDTLVQAFQSPQVQEAITRLQTAFGVLQEKLQPLFDKIKELTGSGGEAGSFFSLETAIALVIGIVEGLTNTILFITPIVEFLVGAVIKAINTFIWFKSAITKVITDVISFFSNFDENVKRLWNDIVNTVQTTIVNLANMFLNFFTVQIPYFIGSAIKFFWDLPKKLPEIMNNLYMVTSIAWDRVKNYTMFVVTSLVNGVTTFFSELPGKLKKIWEDITTWLSGIDLKKYGSDAIQGLWDGMKSVMSKVTSWMNEQVQKIKDAFKLGLKIKSPSKVFDYYGQMIGQGLENGLSSSMDGIYSAYNKMIPDVSLNTSAAEPVAGNTGNMYTINLNPSGIFARSRSEVRDVAIDMVNLINDELRARGVTLLADGVTL